MADVAALRSIMDAMLVGFEYPVADGLRYAGAVVCHRDLSGAIVESDPDLHDVTAMAKGVRQEIPQHLVLSSVPTAPRRAAVSNPSLSKQV